MTGILASRFAGTSPASRNTPATIGMIYLRLYPEKSIFGVAPTIFWMVSRKPNSKAMTNRNEIRINRDVSLIMMLKMSDLRAPLHLCIAMVRPRSGREEKFDRT